MCSCSSIEDNVYDKLDFKKAVSGINGSKKYSPEGEWLGITYKTGERIKFGESVLVMVMGKTQRAEVGSRGSGDGKYEDSFFG